MFGLISRSGGFSMRPATQLDGDVGAVFRLLRRGCVRSKRTRPA